MGLAERSAADFAGARMPDDDATIRNELAPGERVLWQGRPGLGRLMLWSVPVALAGIPFSGFALFWIVAASSIAGEAPSADGPFLLARLIPLFGLPFLAVGVGMMLMPAWAAWKGARTRYAITERRAIICEPQWAAGIQTRSYGPEALGNVVRNQRGDGSGDLILEEIRTLNTKGRESTHRRGFFAVEDVRAVEHLLRSTLPVPRRGTER